MYQVLLYAHSLVRYVVLLLLIIVMVRSLLGWSNKKPFRTMDNKYSLFLLIATHIQFVVGLFLYFISPFVQFNATTMKDAGTRYWSVEHITMMLMAVVLITVARSTSKRMKTDEAKFKRLFVFNSIALAIIAAAIVMSHRGLLGTVVFS